MALKPTLQIEIEKALLLQQERFCYSSIMHILGTKFNTES